MRLHVLVEGPTEEKFVARVLGPHLNSLGIATYQQVVETSRDRQGTKHRGGGDWAKWRRDLVRLTGQHKGNDVRFRTMFDLYGLPKTFPGRADTTPLGTPCGASSSCRMRWRRTSGTGG